MESLDSIIARLRRTSERLMEEDLPPEVEARLHQRFLELHEKQARRFWPIGLALAGATAAILALIVLLPGSDPALEFVVSNGCGDARILDSGDFVAGNDSCRLSVTRDKVDLRLHRGARVGRHQNGIRVAFGKVEFSAAPVRAHRAAVRVWVSLSAFSPVPPRAAGRCKTKIQLQRAMRNRKSRHWF